MQIRNLLAVPALASTIMFAQQTTQTPATPAPSATPAPAAKSSPSAESGDSGPMMGPPEMKFFTEAVRGNLFEIQVAELAQEKAASAEVKQFAQKLKQDHTKANDQLKMIAQERQVQMPSDIGDHQKTISKLSGLSGEQFDKEFLKMQTKHHKKDISNFQKQSKDSMDSDLKEFATLTLPVLEGHLQQAQSLASGSGSRSRQN